MTVVMLKGRGFNRISPWRQRALAHWISWNKKTWLMSLVTLMVKPCYGTKTAPKYYSTSSSLHYICPYIVWLNASLIYLCLANYWLSNPQYIPQVNFCAVYILSCPLNMCNCMLCCGQKSFVRYPTPYVKCNVCSAAGCICTQANYQGEGSAVTSS